jgi:Ca2+-binding RTX toxin-like protein
LAAGIAVADVSLHRVTGSGADDLIVAIDGGTTQMIVIDYFAAGNANQVESIVFADGTTWDSAAIASRVVSGLAMRGDLGGFTGNDAANRLVGSRFTANAFAGGRGDDSYTEFSFADGDTITEAADGGYDTLYAGGLSFGGQTGDYDVTLPTNVERLVVADAGIIRTSNGVAIARRITGNASDNVIDASALPLGTTGGGHRTRIDGGAGADMMIGGAAHDTYVVDNAADTVIERSTGISQSIDTVESTITYALSDALIENLDLQGTLQNAVAIDGTGNAGNNTIRGNRRANVLRGLDGNDTLVDSLGIEAQHSDIQLDTDTLEGGAGDDRLESYWAADTLDGGTGNDYLFSQSTTGATTYRFGAGEGRDTIEERAGFAATVDVVQFRSGVLPGDVSLRRSGDNLIIRVGTTSDHEITVLNQFATLAWDSSIEEIRFADGTVWNEAQIAAMAPPTFTEGADINVIGTQFDDNYDALGGDDIVYGRNGNDTLRGSAGNDQLYGEGSNDTLYGGDGNDTLDGGTQDDTLEGGADNDMLIGGDGNDILRGDSGADVLQGGLGTNQLLGGDGNDRLEAQGASDVLTGGTGDDAYRITQSATGTLQVVEQAGGGTDSVESEWASFTLGSEIENLTLVEGRAYNGSGNDLANVLTGNSFSNQLYGMAGNDTLLGGAGNDTLDGGAGDDRLEGGAGDDSYVVDSSADQVIEAASAGIDTVRTGASYTLGAEIENLILTGSAAVNGTGNVGHNRLDGSQNSAANVLTGGTGNDTYVLGAGDTIVELAGGGSDTIESSTTTTLAEEIENLTLTGSSAVNGTGNAASNSLAGNGADNVLTGHAGFDSLYGNSGNDTLHGGADGDYLSGGAGNDTLNGDAGDDEMEGGTGNDTYTVDSAGDEVIEASGEGTDTVSSSITLTLSANVENLTLTGSAAINGTGNTLANALNGSTNSAANVLTGGAGNDTYTLGAGDTVVELASQGTDRVVLNAGAVGTYELTSYANVEELTLGSGLNASNANGTDSNNRLEGNASNNVLDGRGGDDLLIGGNGADTLIAGAGNDTLQGGSGNDRLTAGAGTDSLDGGAGTDILEETTAGGSGNTTFIFSRGSNQDTINERGGTDMIQLGTNISTSQLTLTRSGNNLIVGITGTTDTITVTNYFATGLGYDAMIESIRFNDGTVWDQAAIASRVTGSVAPTAVAAVEGTSDTDSGTDTTPVTEGDVGVESLRSGEDNEGDGFDFGQMPVPASAARVVSNSSWLGTSLTVYDVDASDIDVAVPMHAPEYWPETTPQDLPDLAGPLSLIDAAGNPLEADEALPEPATTPDPLDETVDASSAPIWRYWSITSEGGVSPEPQLTADSDAMPEPAGSGLMPLPEVSPWDAVDAAAELDVVSLDGGEIAIATNLNELLDPACGLTPGPLAQRRGFGGAFWRDSIREIRHQH